MACGSLLFGSACASAPTILRSGDPQPVDMPTMAAQLVDRDVVFSGEIHDSPAIHRLQFELIRELHQLRPELIVSMEMFERDAQPYLDDYLAGKIEEAEFLEHSRPWKTYREFYRPIVEYAKTNGLRVIAANMPRRLARLVSKGGDGLAKAVASGEAQAEWFAASTTAPEDDYWRRFQDAMSGHEGTGVDTIRLFYQAQCHKDDTMAESIVRALQAEPGAVVVHLNGYFHSDFGLGTAERVIARRPSTAIATVTAVRSDDAANLEAGRADYVWVVPR